MGIKFGSRVRWEVVWELRWEVGWELMWGNSVGIEVGSRHSVGRGRKYFGNWEGSSVGIGSKVGIDVGSTMRIEVEKVGHEIRLSGYHHYSGLGFEG